ncbi:MULTISPECIES: GlxA family transcriptional regulator [Pseudomonas]|jgi:transcriptional regulator GlxA family with amidase domain|uniref:GlxA family transcriptional regulator n=3 Tax=Pseudomonas TaxID=286 RepID=A0A2A3M4H9_PSEDL|nr:MULTISPECIES: GlxA family transcriptional regulator [Pseudomonas]AHC82227.1 AraC family transcriptional regulator [Pseudomonas monteilii SB3078]AHC87605.1 AraC family transcriptional regulator [Pseudomonas monteilii SB3101]AHZ77039.1 transcriptional regulator AraC [Pseudomonas putida]ESW41334.1 AraC family transcriptional regulator [Pseudomonas taiwanensis SJ9]KAF4557878.1 GlxA family transcriptional regulator [Pseudomonas sp. CES]
MATPRSSPLATGYPVDAPTPKIVGFLVIPNFTTIGFASAVETLRMANLAARRAMFQTLIIAADMEPVSASNGMRILPEYTIKDAPKLDMLFVVGPNPIVSDHNTRAIVNWLRKLAHDQVALGGICTGSHLLARANLLTGYRCTIHWEDIEALKERFPGIIISSQLFELDRDRYTSSGGVASMDMCLQLIAREPGGREIAEHAAELLLCDRVRSSQERQRVPLRQRLGTSQPKLSQVVSIMEANLEDPVTLEELAQLNDISVRQLERLFHKHLQSTPSQYYLELRLSRARQLLLHSESQVRDIALACGFVSPAHFSKCYSRFFGVSPMGERKQVAAAQC